MSLVELNKHCRSAAPKVRLTAFLRVRVAISDASSPLKGSYMNSFFFLARDKIGLLTGVLMFRSMKRSG